jgi:hypothetical protein
VEETALSSDIALAKVVDTVDDGSAGSASDTVVVRLANATNGGDVGLDEVVLGEICCRVVSGLLTERKREKGRTRNTLLGENEIGLELDNLLAHGLDLLLLDLQDAVPVRFLGDLDIRLGLPLLVLERTIKEDDPRVFDTAAHLGVGDVLVEHDTVEDLRVLNLASGNLLDLGVALEVDRLVAVLLARNDANSLEGELAHHVRPPGDELGADGSLDEGKHLVLVRGVDRDGDGLDDEESFGEGTLEGGDDDDGVDVALEVGKSLSENLTGCRGKR